MGWGYSKPEQEDPNVDYYTDDEKSSEDLNIASGSNTIEIYNQAFVILKKNHLVTILKEILSEIKLDSDITKENNKILKIFNDSFIPLMKTKDKLFHLLYQRIYYTGSFYSDLRILEPNEFDLNLVLKFPKETIIKVEYDYFEPSYLKCYVNNSNENFKKLTSEDHLDPSKVRQWLQRVVDISKSSYDLPSELKEDYFQINVSSSGPARTLSLTKRSSKIDIDYVPVFEICLPSIPSGMDYRVYKLFEGNLKCFIVPKPKGNLDEKSWRMHFPEIENKILKNKGCAKSVIKLLKLLRDVQNWKCLASYYLKTIVLWLVLESEEESETFWNECNLGKRFIQALKSLQECMTEGKIPYFFNSKCNLIAKLHYDTTRNIGNRLRMMIMKINNDCKAVIDFFKADITCA